MSDTFDVHDSCIRVRVRIHGPVQVLDANLVLDTGATTTLISPVMLVAAGYDPGKPDEEVFITSATGVAYVPKLKIARLAALGTFRDAFPVVAASLPPSAGVDGLLGLDFVRNTQLTIDSRKGVVTLVD